MKAARAVLRGPRRSNAPGLPDSIIGKGQASAIGTLVERSTRFVMLLHLPDRHGAEAVRDAMITAIAGPAQCPASLADLGPRHRNGPPQRDHPPPSCRSISATRTAPGNAAATKTPTGCCASTSPKAPTCPYTLPSTSPRWRRNSTPAPAKPSTGTPPPRPWPDSWPARRKTQDPQTHQGTWVCRARYGAAPPASRVA